MVHVQHSIGMSIPGLGTTSADTRKVLPGDFNATSSSHWLLLQLGEVNEQMAHSQSAPGPFGQAVPAPGATVVHTLQRHRDILQDYTREFHKTRANVQAQRDRDLLLGSVRRDIE